MRVNYQIRCPTIRLVENGNQLGIFNTDNARKMAFEKGLDLVEMVAHAKPPVCAILHYDKYRYEQKLKQKEARKKQKSLEIKEIRLRPSIQEHDVETKVNAVKKFLAGGKKVMLKLQYKNRELRHKEQGIEVMKKIIESLKDIASVEVQPKFESNNRLICRLEPKKEE